MHYTNVTLERILEQGELIERRAAVLALGFVGDYASNTMVSKALSDPDRCVRLIAEHGIRNIWMSAGTFPERQQLGIVTRLNAVGRHDEALALARRLCQSSPSFGEAWNQCALACFAKDRLGDALRDCRRVLRCNPYQFEAIVGMAYCYLRLNRRFSAIRSLRHALRIHPGLEIARQQLNEMSRDSQ
jgi:Flp pilus assembly protein TadD